MNRIVVASVALMFFVGACSTAPAGPAGQPSVGATSGPTATQPAPPSASASLSNAPVPLPAEIRGDWLADVGTIPNLGPAAPRIQLSLDWQDGLEAWVQTNAEDRLVLHSRSVTSAAGEIRLVTTEADAGCRTGDEGRYRASRSTDGLFLAVTPVEDACATRATTLGRTWVRSLGAVNDGRHGIVNYFSPAIEITLPKARFAAGGGLEAADIESDAGALIAVKNPAGFGDPCSLTGGQHVAVAPTIAAFSKYLKSLPGFTITPTTTHIDGRTAVHLAIKTSTATNCAAGRIYEFAPHDLTEKASWFIREGDVDSIWLVQAGSDLYLLQYIGVRVTLANEQAVLSTIHFIDKLPTS